MKLQKLATEDTEKKNFRFSKSSVNSVLASSPREYPYNRLLRERREGKGSFFFVTFSYSKLFSVFSVVHF